MFVSFLKREHVFANVSDLLSSTVWTFQTVHRFLAFLVINGRKRLWSVHANGKRSGTMNGCNAERSWTPRYVRAWLQLRIGTNSGKFSRLRFKIERNTNKRSSLKKAAKSKKFRLFICCIIVAIKNHGFYLKASRFFFICILIN